MGLSANGGLLTADTMMTGGWDGLPEIRTPGFGQGGEWAVKIEGLELLP